MKEYHSKMAQYQPIKAPEKSNLSNIKYAWLNKQQSKLKGNLGAFLNRLNETFFLLLWVRTCMNTHVGRLPHLY